MGCDVSCINRFIELRLAEAQRKRFNRAARLRLHDAGDGGGIDPAREKRAHRHIRDHLAPDGGVKQGIKLVRCLLEAAGEAIGLRRARLREAIPVGNVPRGLAGREPPQHAGRQLPRGAI